MKRSAILLTVLFLLLAGGIASAQQSDLAVSVIGAFTDNVTGDGLHETATTSAGPLLSYRRFPGEHSGLEVNYAYTKNSHVYSTLAGSQLPGVQTNMHELSAAYVFHLTRGSFQPFALAGGGLLMFHPISNAIDAAHPLISRQTRPTFVYGVGLDYRVRKHLALRAQMRGLVYEAPDFYGQQLKLHTSAAMRTTEPSIGLVYRF